MKTSVLIVEDDIDLRDELADYLSQQGYAVQGVSTVRAAEEALSNTIDLLVLDINLPDGNGFDLCLRLRPYLRSGIVMCTGRSERSLRIDSLKGGADAYLVKPIDPEELLATLISVQRRSQPQAPSLFNLSPPVQWRLDSKRSSLLTPNGTTVEHGHRP
jgi:DNA-binding response OmpR family regulator